MPKENNKIILWFDEVQNTDVPIVGGKNASLGEMINAGMPVPPGFAITAYSYEKFLKQTKIGKTIYEIIDKTITDHNNPRQYDSASKEIRKSLLSSISLLNHRTSITRMGGCWRYHCGL